MADEIKVPMKPEIDEQALDTAKKEIQDFVYDIQERYWENAKTGRSGKMPTISSPRFTGMVNARSSGYVMPGDTLSARDLMQMWAKNEKTVNGEDARTIIEEFLRQLRKDASKMQMVGYNHGKEYEGPGAEKLREMGTKTTWKIPEYDNKSELRSWFINSLAKQFNIPKDLPKDAFGDIMPTNNDLVAGIRADYKAAKDKVFSQLNADLKLGIRNITEGIFSEAGDMNSRPTAEIEASKKRQSDEDYRYAGWTKRNETETTTRRGGSDDDDYVTLLEKRYEDEAKRSGLDIRNYASLKDWAKSIREKRQYLPEESNNIEVENINNNIKTLVRFLTEGQLLDAMPEITQSFNEEQTSIFESLKMLSNYLDSVPDISKYLTFEPKTKEEQVTLGQDLPQFLEQLSDVLVSFVDSQGNKLDTRVESRIKNSIVSINRILGTLDYARQQTGDSNLGFTDTTIQTFWNQLQEHIPFGGKRLYDADAVRSLTSKLGLPTEGNFPIAKVGQHLRGSLPFFPNKEEEDLLDTLNDWLTKLKVYETQEDVFFQVTGTSEEGLIEKYDLALTNLKTILDGMEGKDREQGMSLLRENGIEQTASGSLKSIGAFTESDITDIVELVKNNKDTFSGQALTEQLQRLRNIRAEVTSHAVQSLEYEKEDAEAEIKSLANILMDFPQEDFTMDELSEIVRFGDTDYEDVNLDEIRFIPQENGGKLVTREALQERVKALENFADASYVQQDRDIQEAIGLLEKKYVEERLRPYLEQYLNASSSSEKAKITKQVKTDFSSEPGGDKVIEQWTSEKKEMLNRLAQTISEEREKAAREGEIEQLKEAWKERQEQEKREIEDFNRVVKSDESNSAYIDTVSKTYGTKTYAGPGIMFEGKPTFISDIKKEYQVATEERKEQIEKNLQKIYDDLTQNEKEWMLAELQRLSKWTYSAEDLGIKDENYQPISMDLTGLWDSFKGYSGITQESLDNAGNLKYDSLTHKFIKPEDTIKATQALQKEQDALEEINQTAKEHVQSMEKASDAEQAKIVVSQKLAEQLGKEQDALEDVQNQVKQEGNITSDRFGHVTGMEGFKPEFNEDAHQYSKDGVPFYSVTQLRDALIRGKNPAFAQDLANIKKKAQENFEKGIGAISADEFEGMQEKDFKFMVENIIGQGLRGDVFHSLIDKMVKNDVQTMEDLAQKAPDEYKDWQKEYQNAVTELKKYGIDEAFMGIDERLNAYMEAMRKSGMKATEFSEQRMAFTMHGSRGDINIGVTPDQLYSMGGVGAFVDSKTGGVKGLESFQLTAQLLATMANLDTEFTNAEGEVKKLRDMVGDIDMDKPMKAYIADIQDGMTTLTEYLYLSADEFYNLAVDGVEILKGNRAPLTKEEQRSRMNRQLKTGNIVGMTDQYVNNLLAGEFVLPSERDQVKQINSYLNYYKQIRNIEQEILSLEEKSQTANEEELKSLQDQINVRKGQIEVLKQGISEGGLDLHVTEDELGGQSYMIGNTILSRRMAQAFDQKKLEIDTGIDKKEVDRIAKLQQSQTKLSKKERDELLDGYLKDYKELLKYQREELNLERQLEPLRVNSPDSQSTLEKEATLRATKVLKERAQSKVDSYGLSDTRDSFSIGKNNIKLSTEEAKEFQNELTDIENKGNLERSKLDEKYAAQKEKVAKNLNSELLKNTELRNRYQLELEKLNTQEIADPTKADDKVFQERKQIMQDFINDQEKLIKEVENQAERLGVALSYNAVRLSNNDLAMAMQGEQNKRQSILDAQNGVSDKQVGNYLTNLKQQLKIQQEIYSLDKKMESQSEGQRRNSELYKTSLQEQLNLIQQQAPLFDAQNQTLNGKKLTEQQITKILEEQRKLYADHNSKIQKINASQRENRNILSEIAGGFRQAFRNLTDASLAYEAIGMVRRGISEVIQATKELDSALVDIQIATGETREETKELMRSYNDLADELGRTTQDVAIAANDWLRAGYSGQEATELTRASMELSTLGMLNSADATSYLISVLKGWKLEASEVTDVVDKLVSVDIKIGIVSFLW